MSSYSTVADDIVDIVLFLTVVYRMGVVKRVLLWLNFLRIITIANPTTNPIPIITTLAIMVRTIAFGRRNGWPSRGGSGTACMFVESGWHAFSTVKSSNKVPASSYGVAHRALKLLYFVALLYKTIPSKVCAIKQLHSQGFSERRTLCRFCQYLVWFSIGISNS